MPPARTSRAAQREAAERAVAHQQQHHQQHQQHQQQDDSRSEGSAPGTSGNGNGKNGDGRRRTAGGINGGIAGMGGGGHGGNGGSSGLGGSNVLGVTNSNGTHAHEGIDGMNWSDVPLPVLHKYRHAYRINCPSASPFYAHMILGQGVGKRAPSRTKGRISRESLATAVRKNFNAQPISEADVIVGFLYSVKNQDKSFRLKFSPQPR